MSKDIFRSMKEQMIPDRALETALSERLSKERQGGVAGYLFRWVPALASAAVASVLCFNLAMPAYAEKLPVVGKALEELNESGEQARRDGKTPSFLIFEDGKGGEEPFSLSLSLCECNGLDLVMRIELCDLGGMITDKAEVVALSNIAVEIMGNYIYPTDECPRLVRREDGVFSGWATFNAAPVASLMANGEAEARLYCESVSAYVEGASFEESVSLYTYSFSYCDEFSYEADLSGLEVEYLGLEREGITVEYRLKSDERTDIVFTVDGEVDYGKSYSVYTESAAPSVITVNKAEGEYVYVATFDDGESLKLDGVTEDGIFVEGPYYLYSHATGEYVTIEEQCEVEG